MSVRTHGPTRVPLDAFLSNLIFEYFSKICGESFKFHSNLTRITGIWHDGLCTSVILSCWILLRIRNVSGKNCWENQKTHFKFITSFISVCSGIRKTHLNLWTCRLHMTPPCHLHTSDRRLQMCYGLQLTLHRQWSPWLTISPSKESTTEVCIWGWKQSRLPKRSALIIQQMPEKF
jgi:hypothetical protein